jgi:hypothetical protein
MTARMVKISGKKLEILSRSEFENRSSASIVSCRR